MRWTKVFQFVVGSGISKVSRIHPLWTLNASLKYQCNASHSCFDAGKAIPSFILWGKLSNRCSDEHSCKSYSKTEATLRLKVSPHGDWRDSSFPFKTVEKKIITMLKMWTVFACYSTAFSERAAGAQRRLSLLKWPPPAVTSGQRRVHPLYPVTQYFCSGSRSDI